MEKKQNILTNVSGEYGFVMSPISGYWRIDIYKGDKWVCYQPILQTRLQQAISTGHRMCKQLNGENE